jgi:ERO1-like protein alpha
LQENKESYTAYNGSNIWKAIYEENCMLDKISDQGHSLTKLETCSEETLLYQTISGLHASVNMHVASRYFDADLNRTYANHTMYFEAIGRHPDRIKNLYFVYAMVVRAVNRIHEQLITHDYTTGLCYEQDRMT